MTYYWKKLNVFNIFISFILFFTSIIFIFANGLSYAIERDSFIIIEITFLFVLLFFSFYKKNNFHLIFVSFSCISIFFLILFNIVNDINKFGLTNYWGTVVELARYGDYNTLTISVISIWYLLFSLLTFYRYVTQRRLIN